MNMTVGEVARACNGVLPPGLDAGAQITGISTDTREDLSGKLFVPLKGPNFDGHAFVGGALEKAVAALSEHGGGNAIKVGSTYKALADIAAYYRSQFNLPVVGVTGSAGKTTTKDLIASVLSQKYKTLKTEGNLNNEIGLPRMAFQLDGSHGAAVLEMGMNHAGEIHNLSRVAKPYICVITNIGSAHIENLGSRENILAAKCEIFDFMDENGICVLNGDDEMLSKLPRSGKLEGKRFVYYSANSRSADLWASRVRGAGVFKQSCDIHCGDWQIHVEIPLAGAHMVSNALCAAAVGHLLGLPPEQVKAGIEAFKPSKDRMEIISCNGIEVINDVYNANPDSVLAAVSVLTKAQNRTAAILGDMFELGGQAPELHYKTGKAAANAGVNMLVCVGALSSNMYDGFIEHKQDDQEVFYFETKEECGEALGALLKPGDTVLVKASRGMGLEYIVEILRKGARHE